MLDNDDGSFEISCRNPEPGWQQERVGAAGFISFNHSTPALPQVNNQKRMRNNMGNPPDKFQRAMK